MKCRRFRVMAVRAGRARAAASCGSGPAFAGPLAAKQRTVAVAKLKRCSFDRGSGRNLSDRLANMRARMGGPEEIEGLTAAQIQEKFALPSLPDYVSDVHVPAGARIRIGTVAAQEGWGTGNAIQYELLERIPEAAFKNTRSLHE